MTDDDRKPGAVADLIEDLLAEDEIERRMAMPEEQRRAELKAMGLDADRADAIANEVLAKAGFATTSQAPTAPATPPKVIDFAKEKEKRRRPTWVLALVAAAAATVVVGGGGAVYVALNTPTPTPTTPVPSISTAPPGPPPELLAQQEQRAKVECGQESWGKCSEDLVAARALDPQGEDRGAAGSRRTCAIRFRRR